MSRVMTGFTMSFASFKVLILHALMQMQGTLPPHLQGYPQPYNGIPLILYCDTLPIIRVIPSPGIYQHYHFRVPVIPRSAALSPVLQRDRRDWRRRAACPEATASGKARTLPPPGAKHSSPAPTFQEAAHTHISVKFKMQF